MLIRRVELIGFFGITDTLVFPESGVLKVVSPNGSGKTARILDAPSWAVWGRTLRRTPPTPISTEPTFAEVALVTDKVEVVRSTKRGKKLSWNYHDQQPVVYETVSKSEAALERVLGDQNSWIRTHVFSSRDANLFSTATDGERKRLLERMMGLDIFDDAYKFVQQASTARKLAITSLQSELSLLEERISEVRNHAASLKELAKAENIDRTELEKEKSGLLLEREGHQRTYHDSSSELVRAQTLVAVAQKQQISHKDGICYACRQKIPDDILRQQDEELSRAIQEANDIGSKFRLQTQQATLRLADIDRRLSELQSMLDRSSSNGMVSSKLADLKKRYEADKTRLMNIQFDLEFLQDEESVTSHALRILGLQGVRARILGRALTSLEDLANLYLSWLNTPTRITLSASTEAVSGKVVDKISIGVDGFGGGHGYEASSGGERRRLDMAILLALASLSGSHGTLIFDEAFDALDHAGVESASELIGRIAENRPVVVITHNASLISALAGDPVSFPVL